MTAVAGSLLLVGINALGLEVARELHGRALDVLVVDCDGDAVAHAQDLGLRAQQADFTRDEVLLDLGLGRDVGVLFALLPEDATNVFLVISARALAPQLPIISVAGSVDARTRLLAAGATKVIDPFEISGQRIYQLIRHPHLAEMLETTVFGSADLAIAEVRISSMCPFQGHFLDDLDLAETHNLVVLGLIDRELGQDLIFSTRGSRHCLDADDVLVVIGPREDVERLRTTCAGT